MTLEIQNLSKGYQLGERNIQVLKSLSLTVETGEIVVIMGPSGSGKTTLLNCISGIDSPDQGIVKIKDIVVDFKSEKQRILLRRYQIGIVFQFFNLIPTLDVKENIALPFLIANGRQHEHESRVDEILQTLGLQKRKNHYPYQLSGGEMQLVSIARALVHHPGLLLADEPTGNVNPNIGKSIMEFLRTTVKQQNTSVLMVTHSPDHAAWADRICFLKDGCIIGELEQNAESDNVAPIFNRLLELEI